MSVVQRINCLPQTSSYGKIKMPSEKDKKCVSILFVDWQWEKSKNKKWFEEDVPRKKIKKWLALQEMMDYEDKEWPVEHSGERDKEKLTVSKT